MSNFFSSLTSIGAKFVGGAVSSGLDYIYDALPSGVQSTLSSVGSFFDIGSSDIGKAAGDFTKNLLSPGAVEDGVELGDLPSAGSIRGSNFSSRGGFQAGRAQMMPFGKTDRVSRAMQDPRVKNKLMKLAQGRIPSPTMRLGSNISLATARIPSVSLTRKYSRG
jgi:hypothetical protein